MLVIKRGWGFFFKLLFFWVSEKPGGWIVRGRLELLVVAAGGGRREAIGLPPCYKEFGGEGYRKPLYVGAVPADSSRYAGLALCPGNRQKTYFRDVEMPIGG